MKTLLFFLLFVPSVAHAQLSNLQLYYLQQSEMLDQSFENLQQQMHMQQMESQLRQLKEQQRESQVQVYYPTAKPKQHYDSSVSNQENYANFLRLLRGNK